MMACVSPAIGSTREDHTYRKCCVMSACPWCENNHDVVVGLVFVAVWIDKGFIIIIVYPIKDKALALK